MKLIPKKLKKKIRNYMLKKFKAEIKNTECKYKLSIENEGKLKDKVAIITGGSGAIGSSIAFELAMQGATCIVCGRNEEKLKQVVEQIIQNNGKAEYKILDVTKVENIEKVYKEIFNKFGRIDILINNAGGSARADSKELEYQDIKVLDEVINTNLMGTIYCTKFVIQYMKKNNYGKIINMGSTTGVQGNYCNSEYSAAKSALLGFTKSLGMELGKYNINVNCISPGRIRQVIFDEGIEDIQDSGCYLNRLGKTRDIASAAAFLVSDEANYITGQNLIIDGGRSLGLKQ